jgi:hypothetical protein
MAKIKRCYGRSLVCILELKVDNVIERLKKKRIVKEKQIVQLIFYLEMKTDYNWIELLQINLKKKGRI